MTWQVLEGGELQAVQRDVMRVQIDDVDRGRSLGEVGEHIAAAGADCDDAMMRLQLHGLHIEIGVFPDLRIDEAGEE